jgi:hypothetical protein
MPQTNPFGLAGIGNDGGFGGDMLRNQAQETDEERRKRLQRIQARAIMQPVSSMFGVNAGLGPVSTALGGAGGGR